jgi:hypothetical protein
MSFGLHLFLAIIWFLITLTVLGFGFWALLTGAPVILAITCFLMVAISSLFIISDVKMLFGKKNGNPTV